MGWWRSKTLCLELFANGDFQLSLMNPGAPKVQILGGASVARSADRVAVRLAVTRIWRARYLSRCRRVHEGGHWVESQAALGLTFKAGGTHELTLRRIGDAEVELCGESCATLHRETSVLGGRWRRGGFDNPSRPSIRWAAGDILELGLGEPSSHVWIGASGAKWDRIPATALVRVIEADRFAITLVSEGKSRELTATRLAGERIEVCAPDKRCATLERQFDSYDYDLR